MSERIKKNFVQRQRRKERKNKSRRRKRRRGSYFARCWCCERLDGLHFLVRHQQAWSGSSSPSIFTLTHMLSNALWGTTHTLNSKHTAEVCKCSKRGQYRYVFNGSLSKEQYSLFRMLRTEVHIHTFRSCWWYGPFSWRHAITFIVKTNMKLITSKHCKLKSSCTSTVEPKVTQSRSNYFILSHFFLGAVCSLQNTGSGLFVCELFQKLLLMQSVVQLTVFNVVI